MTRTAEAEAAAILNKINETETRNALMVFVDRFDDIQFAELEEEDGIETSIRLHSEAGNSRPYFEVCTLINGQLTDSTADEILLLPWTLDDITQAVASAREERERFYAERAEIFGASAYPRA